MEGLDSLFETHVDDDTRITFLPNHPNSAKVYKGDSPVPIPATIYVMALHQPGLHKTELPVDMPESRTFVIGFPDHSDQASLLVVMAASSDNKFNSQNIAKTLGYDRRIPPQKAPFNSHGQSVFWNGKNYITSDIDGHNVKNGWKMFDKKGRRTGTWNSDLSKRIKD